MIFGSVQG